jgi:hypothetical protein
MNLLPGNFAAWEIRWEINGVMSHRRKGSSELGR